MSKSNKRDPLPQISQAAPAAEVPTANPMMALATPVLDRRRSDFAWNVAKKVTIWASFFAGLWLFSEFLSLIVITFIVCYILNSLTVYLMKRFTLRRRPVVTGIFSVLAVLLVVGMVVLVPRVAEEGKKLYREMPQTVQKVQKSVSDMLESTVYERVQSLGIEQTLQDMAPEFAKKATTGVTTGLKEFVKFLFHLFLSLILAFLILFDLPKMVSGVQSFAHSRVGAAYEEIAPRVVNFFGILGKVFEAQVLIASVNCMITFAGLLVLGIPFALVLSLGVLLGGFIPVLGVFISSIPIVLVAFNVGGFALSFKVVGLVTLVHMMEAYVLNPQIMGEHLSIHPLVVLVVLLVGETFFGVWGLLLGVPVTMFIYRDVIQAVPGE